MKSKKPSFKRKQQDKYLESLLGNRRGEVWREILRLRREAKARAQATPNKEPQQGGV